MGRLPPFQRSHKGSNLSPGPDFIRTRLSLHHPALVVLLTGGHRDPVCPQVRTFWTEKDFTFGHFPGEMWTPRFAPQPRLQPRRCNLPPPQQQVKITQKCVWLCTSTVRSCVSLPRDCGVKAEEASVDFVLRKLSPFPLGSGTEPELVLRKPGSGLKITGYKGCGTVAPRTPAAAAGGRTAPGPGSGCKDRNRVCNHSKYGCLVALHHIPAPYRNNAGAIQRAVSMNRNFTPPCLR